MPMIKWETKAFGSLGAGELYELLKLRVDIFVVEQNCAYAELDGKDLHPGTLHMTGRDENGGLAAYLRILPPGLSFDRPSIGRVVVSKKSRGQGLCRLMVEQAVDRICRVWPGMGIRISAQVYLEPFYRSCGFEIASDTYLEDGIPHLDMVREDG